MADVSFNSVPEGTLPWQANSSTTESIAQADTSAGGQANRYTAAQSAGQNTALSALSSLLSGQSQIPSSFGLPQVAYDAAMANFNKFQAPQLTAGLGSGAAGAINAAMQELQLQLAGMAGQNAMSNFNAMAGNLGNLSFNAIGQDTNQNGNRNVARTLDTKETGFDPGASLGALLDYIGKIQESQNQQQSGATQATGQLISPSTPTYQPLFANGGTSSSAPSLFL